MTDKELAEKYTKVSVNEYKDSLVDIDDIDVLKEAIAEAYFAGLKAARQEMWHDLRKNSKDLPSMIKDERMISDLVWIHIKNWGTEVSYYDYRKNAWIVRCRVVNLDVLAWCEIPTFKE